MAKRLNVGDLAIYNSVDEDPDMITYAGSVVRITEVIEEEFRYYDYFVLFPDNRTLEVTDDELEPIFYS